MNCCLKCRVFANSGLLLKLEHPSNIRKRILSGNMDAYEHQNNVNAFCECSRRFSLSVPSSCFGCHAHISPHLIVGTLLSRAAMVFSSGVNYITIMRRIEVSKLSPDINPSVTRQKRSTEGCSKFKSPETRQVQERLVLTLEHMQVPKWDRTRCPEE